jgi:hypothetical protein
MGKLARNTIMIFNAAGVVGFSALWFYASSLAPLGSMSRITELDRAGVIDEQKLAAFRPTLVNNLRHDLPAWIAEKERTTSKLAAICGLLVCSANLGVIYCFRSARGRHDPEAHRLRER